MNSPPASLEAQRHRENHGASEKRRGVLIQNGSLSLLGPGEDTERPFSVVPKAEPANLPTFERRCRRTPGLPYSRTSPARRVEVLCAALAVTLAVTLLISARLWLSARDYPLVPAWSGLP